MERMQEKFGDQVTFIAVYIKEMHPTEGWDLGDSNVCYRSPKTLEERRQIARDFVRYTKFSVDLYVDDISDHTAIIYEALPERLYIIENGIIVYKGGEGPFEYIPSDVDAWLAARFPGR